MADPTRIKKQMIYNQDEQSDDIDDDLQEENSFEGGNKLFQLKSQINTLKIEKNRLSLQHQAALSSLETKNQQLNQQINNLKRQNTKYQTTVRKLEIDNQQLRKINENYKHQIQSANRRTADFHRSIDDGHGHGLGDPSQFIQQMMQKDKKIEELQKKIDTLQIRPASSVSSAAQKTNQAQKQKYEQQIKSLKTTIDQLKKKQIAYKRQYEGMIQSKQQIIKKMSIQNEQYSRKITQSKDKIIAQLKKQHEQLQKRLEQYKNQASSLSQKLSLNERQMSKIKTEYKRKQQSLLNHYENEKDDMAKGLNDKMKRIIKQKQQRLIKSQQKVFQLQNAILITKQELGKQKAEVVSLNQFNSYLQTSNRQYEQTKKKLQATIYQKQKQISEVRQSFFTEISQLKKNIMSQRAQNQQKCASYEEQLLTKHLIIQKYEKDIEEQQRREQEGFKNRESGYAKQLEKNQREREQMGRQIESLEERLRDKNDKLISLEKKIRKQFEQRVTGLQKDLLKERETNKQISRQRQKQLQFQKQKQFEFQRQIQLQKQRQLQLLQSQKQLQKQLQSRQQVPMMTQNFTPQPPPVAPVIPVIQPVQLAQHDQLQKYINISELRKIQLEEKQSEIRRLQQDKNRLEKQIARHRQECLTLERKVRDKIQDYKNLEVSYDQLGEKYRKGVKQLQNKMQQMQQSIAQQRKKAQKRKLQSQQTQKTLSQQLKVSKSRIRQLEQQLSQYKNKKIQDAQYTDLKLQKLAHQISLISKQKQSAIRSQQRKIKQKQDILIEQKNKLLQYIEQLEENNQILNKKVAMAESRDKKNVVGLQKQLRDIKFQYSQTLKQLNLVLQRYKKLEDVHREVLNNIETIKEQKEVLNKKYVQLYKQKNKIFDELNSCYDQINKLNLVLMSKEEQLSRTKTVNCPHFESKTRMVYHPPQMQIPETPVFSMSTVSANQNNPVGSSMNHHPTGMNMPSKSPHKYYDRNESFYTNSNSVSNYHPKYSRYG